MRRVTYAGAVVVLSAVVVGCASMTSSEPSPTPTPSASSDRADVRWKDYPPSAQQIIDDAQAAGDCGALQDSFDVADTAGFTDQMRYIDEALDLAGCYE